MSEITKYINSLVDGSDLSEGDSSRAFQIIMMGGATPAQIAAFIIALRIKGETIDEITGAVRALRTKAHKLEIPSDLEDKIIDTCGTGGDGKHTYNISTTVAFVLAGCGVPVAKHGNRSISSRSGSSDVLTALGVKIDITDEIAVQCLKQAGICFMPAPQYHSAMRHVAPVRQELKMRTIFNILGPMINPALPKKQIIGVYDKKWLEPIAKTLKNLGTTDAWIVHGSDGMDEITLFGDSYITELKGGNIRSFTINPQDYGIEIPDDENVLRGGNPIRNSQELHNILGGKLGAYRDIVLLNSAAGLVVSGDAEDFAHGLKLATESIDSGKAKKALYKLVEITNLDELG